MSCQENSGSNLITIHPSGRITAINANEFQRELAQTISDHSTTRCLVNMRQVEFLDSTGLMALVSALRLAETLGKRFFLCAIPAPVKIIFEVTQLDKAFHILENHESLESDLNSIYELEPA